MTDALDESGLRGRGGADFPTGVKWRAVKEHLATRGGDAVVVANAAECEPASFKDRFLLTHRPHLVLDGLEHAAEAVGARRVVIFTTRAHGDVEAGLRAAITERRRRDGNETFIEVQVGPNRYVAGEETALISRISGHLAKPKVVPPRPFQSGVDRLPTLVQNVETLAHAALVARFGASWFRSAGTLTVARDGTSDRQRRGANAGRGRGGLRFDRWRDRRSRRRRRQRARSGVARRVLRSVGRCRPALESDDRRRFAAIGWCHARHRGARRLPCHDLWDQRDRSCLDLSRRPERWTVRPMSRRPARGRRNLPQGRHRPSTPRLRSTCSCVGRTTFGAEAPAGIPTERCSFSPARWRSLPPISGITSGTEPAGSRASPRRCPCPRPRRDGGESSSARRSDQMQGTRHVRRAVSGAHPHG